MGETNLPLTPSLEVPDNLVESPIEADETGKPSEHREGEDDQKPYVSPWNIYPTTQLRQPLDRAEWVSRALPPGKMALFSEAKMLDICDLANRAAVLVTVSANSMQQLLCAQDTQVKQWKAEVTALRLGKRRADRLTEEAVQRERNASRELNTLREQARRVPQLEKQLAQTKSEMGQLKAQGAELEEAKKQVAKMEALKIRLVQKEKEVKELDKKNVTLSQDLVLATEKLSRSKETRRYLMTTGISEIVAKCRASHEFGKLVGRLTEDTQAMGKTNLVRELQPQYFPNKKIEDIPGFCEEAESRAEAALRCVRYEPIPFKILTDLAAKPDMSSDEIRKLENLNLLSGQE